MDKELLKDYMDYKPLKYLSVKYDVPIPSIIKWSQPYRLDKARLILPVLEDLDDSFPQIIKVAIWKLQIISAIAQKYCGDNIGDYNTLEKIESYTIKAKLEDYSIWAKADVSYGVEVSVVSEATRLPLEWIAAMSDGNLSQLEQYAKSLRDKVTLAPVVKERPRYSDMQAHMELCKELSIDPNEYTEHEAIALKDKYDILKGLS